RQSPKSTNEPAPTSAPPPTSEAPPTSAPAPMDMRIVRDMDARFIAERISPGGAADLLAITWFMHFVDTETCPAAINPA
ncbi:MAG: triphosphoribosyl-dephospho-CoA synthase, partial [Clostridia bacterium]